MLKLSSEVHCILIRESLNQETVFTVHVTTDHAIDVVVAPADKPLLGPGIELCVSFFPSVSLARVLGGQESELAIHNKLAKLVFGKDPVLHAISLVTNPFHGLTLKRIRYSEQSTVPRIPGGLCAAGEDRAQALAGQATSVSYSLLKIEHSFNQLFAARIRDTLSREP